MADQPPDFVTVALLYKKTSRSGKTLYFGTLRLGTLKDVRLYLFERENRTPKDCQPTYDLCIRMEDWQKIDG